MLLSSSNDKTNKADAADHFMMAAAGLDLLLKVSMLIEGFLMLAAGINISSSQKSDEL